MTLQLILLFVPVQWEDDGENDHDLRDIVKSDYSLLIHKILFKNKIFTSCNGSLSTF